VARIVLIDDDEAFRGFLAEVLTEASHEVVPAGSGPAGLEAIRGRRPDLVLCDVQMPGMDGYQVLEGVRADPDLASVPFLFLTGLAAMDEVRSGMLLGADDYITKPVKPDDLVAAVDARLSRHDALRRESDRRADEIRRGVAMLLPHELRTPLTTILGNAQLIELYHRDMKPDQVAEMAAAIVKAAKRLHRMVENSLLYAGLELDRLARSATRPLVGTSGPEDVRESAVAHAALLERARDLELDLSDVEIPVAAPYVRKVVTELVDNAVKFSKPGTPVKVSLRRVENHAVLEVVDSGRGMTPDQVREVSAFRQFDRAIFEQQGAGLGLALVRGIVEASGGGAEILGLPAGTRVVLRWPAAAGVERPPG
jgi:signal transduction histidine kinase